MNPEKDILLALQKQDKKTQTAFYNFYKRRLMGICRRYAKNDVEAEDIFQEAFVRIFSHIHQVKQESSLGFWVKRTVINTAVSYYHQFLKEQSQMTDYEDVTVPYHDDLQMFAQLSTEELLLLINQLPHGYRMVFNMYVIDGYNHAEISQQLGVSEGTSKSQLSKAKDMLRQKLKLIGIVNYETS